MVFDGVIKANVLHSDISFQKMRSNKNNKLIICDFDMAIEPHIKALELCERIKTFEFMAKRVLNGELYQAFHYCKFVYWLYSIVLLQKHFSSIVEKYVKHIINSSQEFVDVKVAKMGFMAYLLQFNKLGAEIQKKIITKQIQPRNIVEKDPFKCLIDLTNYFHS